MKPTSFGAALAAIWSPKRIVFIAGSTPTSDKNILQENGVHFALAGLTACAATGFNAGAILSKNLSIDTIGQLGQELEEPLRDAVQHIHDHDADSLKKYLTGKNALDGFFFYKKGDSVFLSQISFKTKKRGKGVILSLSQRNYPNRDTDIHSIVLVTAGVGAAVENEFVTKTSPQQALVYPQEALKKFMALAVAEPPTKYPAHIVEISTGGVKESVIDE